jgi:tRNA pseudouridine13 synthase
VKLRQLPEDFIVEELNTIPLAAQGPFKVYLLEKKGVETLSILSYLAKHNGVPRGALRIAGLKDKHAITKQYLTVPEQFSLRETGGPNARLQLLGHTSDPITVGQHQGNRFSITARDLSSKECEAAQVHAKNVEHQGVPNYFDSQRFGSVHHQDFHTKHVLNKEYQDAVKAYLTQYPKGENKRIKDEKRTLAQHWPHLNVIRPTTTYLAQVTKAYLETKDWKKAYQAISSRLKEIHAFAYQSFLWNQCLKELLQVTQSPRNLYEVDYALGQLLYYKELHPLLPEHLSLISGNTKKPSGLEERIITKILHKEGFTLHEMNLSKEDGGPFRSGQRTCLLKPKDFTISPPGIDELNPRRMKMHLTYELPPGAYATIILKGIFGR